LVWDGSRWSIDDTGLVYRKAKDAIDRMHNDASRVADDAVRQICMKHVLKTESEGRLRAMVSLAQSEGAVGVTVGQLDADPMLLNCENGTLDLRTGTLGPHRREDLITKLAPVVYDPTARCPLFDGFIRRIFGGNKDLIRYVQRCIGYSLTGDITAKSLFFFYGTGDNGKTTLLEAIRQMLGDYAGQVPIDTLMLRPQGGIPNDIALLRGLRFVTSSETEEGQRLAQARLKYLTGMNTIQARFLHQEFFEFQPTHKIFLDANHQPQANSGDPAIWSRIKLIPFMVSIPDEEKDRRLGEKLRAELPGILAWAVQGCAEWLRHGLEEPAEVRDATQAYRDEMDTFKDFLEDCCVIGAEQTTPVTHLYNAYQAWCYGSGEQAATKKALGRLLTARCQVRQSRTAQGRSWTGIGLRSGVPAGQFINLNSV
jgi:putative DNA primase/helicase